MSIFNSTEILKGKRSEGLNRISKMYKSIDPEIEKGTYKNNSENQKLGRVGKTYGKEKIGE